LTRISRFKGEYDALAAGSAEGFSIPNGRFESVDAEMLYSMVRLLCPRRIVEIGSGFSTRVSSAALTQNAAAGSPGHLTAIEPNPPASLVENLINVTLIQEPLEEVGTPPFLDLQADDILFIDSSHVLRQRSDVQLEFLEIIPRLAVGVYVHVHDVFLPWDYPDTWLLEQRRFFNEQYLLQAFLAFNEQYRIIWASAHMHATYPSELEAAFESYRPRMRPPGSFWFKRV
jgi:predicted O-methyltransferase YrrM